MQWNITPYEGQEPYIFISYCHNDEDTVLPLLELMERAGFRIWFDQGIQWGEKWPASIEKHLSGCEVCMAFCSKNSAKSKECTIEIAYAIDCNRKLLSVYMDDIRLEPWIEMRKSIYQSAFMYAYHDYQEFFYALSQNEILQPCRDQTVVCKNAVNQRKNTVVKCKDEVTECKKQTVAEKDRIRIMDRFRCDYGAEEGVSVCGEFFSVSGACDLDLFLRGDFDSLASLNQDEFASDSPLIRHMKLMEASSFLKKGFFADKEAENKGGNTTKCIHGKENI